MSEDDVCTCGHLARDEHLAHGKCLISGCQCRGCVVFSEDDLELEIAFEFESRVDRFEAYRLLEDFREAYKARGGRQLSNEKEIPA